MENIIKEKIQTLINIADFAKKNLNETIPISKEKNGQDLCNYYAQMFNQANIALQKLLQENYCFCFPKNFTEIFGS